jgi:transposase
MRVLSIAKGFHKLSRQIAPELKEKERDRIRAITLWQRTKDMPLVCETFGMGRATLYRWIRRYSPKDLTSVKDRSRRPYSIRKPKWSYELIGAVKALREQYPRWGKDKLVVLLTRQGWKTSTSTVGRILTHLKKKGQIVEP